MTISKTHEHAFWLLRNEIYAHLDGAEFLVLGNDAWSDQQIDSARKIICDLVIALRNTVAQHSPDSIGRCRFCQGAWPCRSIQAIHTVLNDPERELVPHQLT